MSMFLSEKKRIIYGNLFEILWEETDDIIYTIKDLQKDFKNAEVVKDIHVPKMIHCEASVQLKKGQNISDGLGALGFRMKLVDRPLSMYGHMAKNRAHAYCGIILRWNGDIDISVTEFKGERIEKTYFAFRKEMRENADSNKEYERIDLGEDIPQQVQDYILIR